MARYVDGYVLPVPKKRVKAYRRMAQKAGQVWRDHGALEYRECVGDDLNVKGMMPFPPGWRRSRARPWSSRGSSSSRAHTAIASTRR